MSDRKIESIEDVRGFLAEVRETLAEVEAMDLSDPNAVILTEPLLELRNALTRAAAEILTEVAERGGQK